MIWPVNSQTKLHDSVTKTFNYTHLFTIHPVNNADFHSVIQHFTTVVWIQSLLSECCYSGYDCVLLLLYYCIYPD